MLSAERRELELQKVESCTSGDPIEAKSMTRLPSFAHAGEGRTAQRPDQFRIGYRTVDLFRRDIL